MSKISSSLAELVEGLNDGIEFYLRAAEATSDAELSQFFQRMSYLKKTIAADLNAEIALEGATPVAAGSLLGNLRQAYAQVMARLGEGRGDFIAPLEEHEDHLLKAFRDAALQDSSSRVRELALMYFPEIEKMHADMRRLKVARPAA